jgi:hypothetical protein
VHQTKDVCKLDCLFDYKLTGGTDWQLKISVTGRSGGTQVHVQIILLGVAIDWGGCGRAADVLFKAIQLESVS